MNKRLEKLYKQMTPLELANIELGCIANMDNPDTALANIRSNIQKSDCVLMNLEYTKRANRLKSLVMFHSAEFWRLSAAFLGSVLDEPESIEMHGSRLKSHLRAFQRLCDENGLSFADISKIAGTETEINLASFDAEFENTRYLELMQILTS